MLKFLYSLIISPIEILVEMVYSVMHSLFHNEGLAIIAVSLVIQTLILPLYKRADALQDEERIRQKKMSHWVDHIKKNFRGDERYMMLSAYYREVGYKQWYAVISSSSILLQIPFFIAAYHFLSTLQKLYGKSFLFIRDLSQPDMALTIGAISLNVLPILMTLANIISGIIYTKGFSFREKAQVYVLALVFLVLLYNSPSGLVLYWTMNNVYSLLKNVFMKLIKPKGIRLKNSWLENKAQEMKGQLPKVFMAGAVFLAIFIGAIIPLNVVEASASEFVNLYHGPIYLVLINLATMIGVFVLWGGIFFFFMKDEIRLIMAVGSIALVGCALLNYLGVTKDMGTITPMYFYNNGLYFSDFEKIINLLCGVLISTMLIIICLKWTDKAIWLGQILIISAIVMSIVSGYKVVNQVMEYQDNIVATRSEKDKKILHFSKSGKNVVVIMLDMAIGAYVPYIFEEKPEIAEMYQGFTFYPNTISFACATNYCAPALFGGYEYTPEAINNRPEQSLKDKHNEALLLMPALFSDAGYQVTVCDPPYAGNYMIVNDLSMYGNYDNIEAYNTEGNYLDKFADLFVEDYQNKQESLTFYHSIMKTLPLVAQRPFYHDGGFCSKKEVVNMDFMEWYSVLENMSNMTEITDDETNNCLVFQNCSTHDISLLSVPDYEPVAGADNLLPEYAAYYDNVQFADDNIELRSKDEIAHYQSNLASLRALGYWFEYLKDNDCWDNTRIILVADHGWYVGSFDNLKLSNGIDTMAFNPILMEKDFGAKEFTVSNEFMTNADVPSLAFDEIIKNPINPFTGKEINTSDKKSPQMITTSRHYSTVENCGNTFDTSDGTWYSVLPDNMFDDKNWIKSE